MCRCRSPRPGEWRSSKPRRRDHGVWRQPGGLKEISRWSSEARAQPHRFHPQADAPRRGEVLRARWGEFVWGRGTGGCARSSPLPPAFSATLRVGKASQSHASTRSRTSSRITSRAWQKAGSIGPRQRPRTRGNRTSRHWEMPMAVGIRLSLIGDSPQFDWGIHPIVTLFGGLQSPLAAGCIARSLPSPPLSIRLCSPTLLMKSSSLYTLLSLSLVLSGCCNLEESSSRANTAKLETAHLAFISKYTVASRPSTPPALPPSFEQEVAAGLQELRRRHCPARGVRGHGWKIFKSEKNLFRELPASCGSSTTSARKPPRISRKGSATYEGHTAASATATPTPPPGH